MRNILSKSYCSPLFVTTSLGMSYLADIDFPCEKQLKWLFLDKEKNNFKTMCDICQCEQICAFNMPELQAEFPASISLVVYCYKIFFAVKFFNRSTALHLVFFPALFCFLGNLIFPVNFSLSLFFFPLTFGHHFSQSPTV